jgi:hypothetical protein
MSRLSVYLGQIPSPRAPEQSGGGCLDHGTLAEPMRVQHFGGQCSVRFSGRPSHLEVPALRDFRRNAAQPATILRPKPPPS